MEGENNPFANAQQQLEQVARLINLNPELHERLQHPSRFIEVNFPVRLDNGKIKIFRGFRSQYNNARGPYKGGIRFSPQVTAAEIKALSM